MKKCDVCGKRAEGLGTYPTKIGSIVLCSTCYEGNKPLLLARRIKSVQKFDDNKEQCILTMKEKNYPETVKTEILLWMKELRNHVIEDEREAVMEGSLKDILMTSGYNFEGYEITEYLGVVYGESVLGTGLGSSWEASISDTFGVESDAFIEKLKKAREMATQRIVREVVRKGGNALIGMDADYTMFKSNMIGVIINATCVIIQKKS